MSELSHQILDYLRDNPNSRAKNISNAIGCDQKDVSRLLFGELEEKVIQNDSYEWSIRTNSTPSISGALETEASLNSTVEKDPVNTRSMASVNLTSEIERFRNRLLDLTNRNPLLNFRKSKVRTLQVVDELPNKIFERLVTENKAFRFLCTTNEEVKSTDGVSLNRSGANRNRYSQELPSHPDIEGEILKRHLDNKLQTNLDEVPLDRVLNRINRDARRSIEETGINYLHLGLGFVEWKDREGATKSAMAPLILIPISIQRNFDEKQAKYVFTAAWTEEEVKFNLSFAKRIENEFGFRIPKFKEDENPEDYFTRVSESISSKSYWKVKRECVVGFFSFHKLLMYNDLENWAEQKEFHEKSVASQLICGSDSTANVGYEGEYLLDEMSGSEDEVKLVLDADSSQHSALIDICRGQNLVIEGPPGTGKSQTITNAIAALISQGKSVLFVAEKLAALNVVKNKLDDLGLGDFCLELHSDGSTPRSVIRSLESRINGVFTAPDNLEETEARLKNDKTAIKEYLNSSVQKVGPRQMPLHEVIWNITEFRGRGLEPLYEYKSGKEVSDNQFSECTDVLERLEKILSSFDAPNESQWLPFSVESLRPNQISHVKTILLEMQIVAEKCDRILLSQCEQFGGQKSTWFEAVNQPNLETLKRLSEFIPAREHECEKLLDSEFCQQVQEAYRVVRQMNSAEEALSNHPYIDSQKYPLAEQINQHLDYLLPNFPEHTIQTLIQTQNTIPPLLNQLKQLEQSHNDLKRLLNIKTTPEWLPKCDPIFMATLNALSSHPPRLSDDCESLLDQNVWDAGNKLCQKLEQLTKVEDELSRQDSLSSTEDDQLLKFAKEVLTPLRQIFHDQTIKAVKRNNARVAQTIRSTEIAAQWAIRLEGLGFNVKNLTQLTEAEKTLQLYEHSIFEDAGSISPKLFELDALPSYKQTQKTLDDIRQKEEQLSGYFHIPSVPSVEELQKIQATLRRLIVSPFRWLNPGYWAAIRKLSNFRQPKKLSPKAWLIQLEQLEKHQVDKQKFNDNPKFKKLFGECFQGIETNAETISTMMRWVATIKKKGVDGALHARLLEELENESDPFDRTAIHKCRKHLESQLASEMFAGLTSSTEEMSATAYRHVREPNQELSTNLNPMSGHFTNWEFQFVEKKLIELQKQIESLSHPPDTLNLEESSTLSEAISNCNLVEQRNRLRNEISEAQRWRLLGDHYNGLQTDQQILSSSLDWIKQLKSLGLPRGISTQLIQQSTSLPQAFYELLSQLHRIESQWQENKAVLSNFQSLRSTGIPKSIEQVAVTKKNLELNRDCIAGLNRLVSEIGFEPSQPLSVLSEINQSLSAKLTAKKILSESKWETLGVFLKLVTDNPITTLRSVAWVNQLQELNLPVDSIARLVKRRVDDFELINERIQELNSCLGEYTELRKALRNLGSFDNSWLELNCRESQNLQELGKSIHDLAEDAIGLEKWAAFCRVRQHCTSLHLDQFVEAVLDERLSKTSLSATYQLTVLENVVGRQFEDERCLTQFSRHSIETYRKNLKQRDRSILEKNRGFIAYRASRKKPPAGVSRGKVADKTEMGLLLHEIGKQKRHVQIRSLLRRAGRSVTTLKPCFMMSPLSVSQFLDPDKIDFDVVIMDEASQIKPEDALGAVLRAKQLIVVGDPKQLPPTSFFDRNAEGVEEELETQFDDNESILEVAMKTFHPIRRLRWHYRSQHESLIHFSNSRFYDGDLVIFPSSSKDSGDLGIYEHFIEGGSFDKGLNHAEATAVATAIAEHAQYCPNQSLGVGTFNMKQAMLIQDKLDQICEKDPSVRNALNNLESNTEKLFIKNLENLQGDERDVIFISYTYGHNPVTGKVYNRFGPLAGEDGWRRLNVMVSRARKRVEVFSSLKASDINIGEGKSRGVLAFRDYLEFAQSGSIIETESVTRENDNLSSFEESIMRVVEKFGLKCRRKVGVAGFFVDIGVVSPYCDDTFILGVVGDGDSYRNAKSARDRDRLRDEVIQSRNWNLHRVWSADWFLNQQDEERRLRVAIEDALNKIPSEFRNVKTENTSQATTKIQYADIDVCDQIVGFLKENENGDASEIAADLNLPEERVANLLRTDLRRFTNYDVTTGWSLNPEFIDNDVLVDFIETKTQNNIPDSRNQLSPSPENSQQNEPTVENSSIARQIIQSPLYKNQKDQAQRGVVDDMVTLKILDSLERFNWQTTVTALSESVSIPPFRLRGMLPGLQRILNVDGQQAMVMCRDSDTVELNEALLKQEFFIK